MYPISWVAAAVLLSCVGEVTRGQDHPLSFTVPFQAGDGKYLIYRIPALWTTPKQPLLAFAEGRVAKRRAAGNIDVVLRRSIDMGETWEPLQAVADFGEDFCGNPCAAQDPTNNRLWLAFTRSRGSDVEEDIAAGKAPATEVWITSSDDSGVTWSAPRNLSETCRKPTWGWYGAGPGLGLFLSDAKPGRLLIPAYHSERGVYRTHCLYSDNHGETWQIGADAADHTSEAQIVAMNDGSLLMNARNTSPGGGNRAVLISRDRGSTWKPATGSSPIPEHDCQGSLFRIPRAGIAKEFDLVFTQPLNRQRTDVQARLSEDNGKTWPFARPLWNGPSAYTAMTELPNCQIGVLLECGNKNAHEQIAFLRFSPAWLKENQSP